MNAITSKDLQQSDTRVMKHTNWVFDQQILCRFKQDCVLLIHYIMIQPRNCSLELSTD